MPVKRTRRGIALLLMLVLALSLTPMAAMADPPQEACREGGEHKWEIYASSATCTEGGMVNWRCVKCGIWYNESVPALGHDWNAGELVQGEGFLGQQIMSYYCWRCGETRDVPVPPSGSAALEWFRNVMTGWNAVSDLHITLQPEGGSLEDESGAGLILRVEAEGGTPPYTYEWRAVDRGVTEYLDGSPVGYAVHSNSRRAAEEANRRRAEFYENYLNFTREHFGVEDTEGAMRGWTELQIREYGDIQVAHGEEPSYSAEIGNCYYYCVVRDSAGGKVGSERAFVGTPLYIALQPEDVQLKKGQALLRCKAGGGSWDYRYVWFANNENIGTEAGPEGFSVSRAGSYYCVVHDGEQELRSETVTVTKSPESDLRPRIVVQPKNVSLKPKTTNHYSASLNCRATLGGGNDKLLQYRWQKMGASGWSTVKVTAKTSFSLGGTGKKISGQYRCVAINRENAAKAVSKTVRIWVKLGCVHFQFKGNTLTGRVLGGQPSYTIVVLQHRPQDQNTPVRKLSLKVKVGANGTFFVGLDPAKYRYYSYVTEQNGKKVIKQARAYYSIIIDDADGQELRTKALLYPG